MGARFVDLQTSDDVHEQAKHLRGWAARHSEDPLSSELIKRWNQYEGSDFDEHIAREMYDLVKPFLRPGRK